MYSTLFLLITDTMPGFFNAFSLTEEPDFFRGPMLLVIFFLATPPFLLTFFPVKLFFTAMFIGFYDLK